MSSDQISVPSTTIELNHQHNNNSSSIIYRDIHALIPPPANRHRRRRESWETVTSHRSSSSSTTADTEIENLSTMSREFSALVLAGSSTVGNNGSEDNYDVNSDVHNNLGRIGEEEEEEQENNPLAIVPDNSDPLPSPADGSYIGNCANYGGVWVERVKKEEVETKICAWQNAKMAKINNRYKREEAIISGWEGEQVNKSTSSMKKVERKLEEKRARASEKMENEIEKAHRKAEERRACAEAKRGTKVAKVLEIANLMKAVGRAPPKHSFF